MNKKSNYWKDNRRYLLLVGAAVAASLALGLITFPAFVAVGSRTAEKELAAVVVEEVEELPPPVVIKVDNVNCVIAEEPTLTYYVMTDTVRVNIECDSDILFHYLPALVEEVKL
jgi:hypothetical protein